MLLIFRSPLRRRLRRRRSGCKGTISSGVYLRGDIGVGQLKTSKYYQSDVASVERHVLRRR